jgi:protein-glutamine gamma-glutamyltransferase
MLKEFNYKQSLILIFFCILLMEVLTGVTLGFVATGVLLALFNIKLKKFFRNILALGVFASYWLTYGKIINPEVGLNFLTSIIVLKMLEEESSRDRYMIFFGFILLISAGTLFERTLTYVIFFSVSFIILIRNFYRGLDRDWHFKDFGKILLWTLPLTFCLFFFVPRLLNPIPLKQGAPGAGEIGYTPDVLISQIESLSSNQTPVFQVLVDQKLSQNDLYWRGNTLSFNDGWNWPLTEQAYSSTNARKVNDSSQINQQIRLYNRADYFFGLDYPSSISFGEEVYPLNSTRTLSQKRWKWVQKYEVTSHSRREIFDVEPSRKYLQTGLSQAERIQINELFPGTSIQELHHLIRNYFLKNNFSYSLSPGKSASFQEFMDKKVGLCSHYASAVALILRTKGIPTRLVSGFMGGSYNRFADFYLISQNDAHVWVEAYSNGKWMRLDPTEWIAPERVKLGGDAFMEGVTQGKFQGPGFFRMSFLNDLKLWFGQWDFHFYQWLEQMDYHTQQAWLSHFKIKRQWLFSIIPVVLIVFMLLYYWYLSRHKQLVNKSMHQSLWRLFFKKMQKRGINLSPLSVSTSHELIFEHNDPKVISVWNDLISCSFKNEALPKDIQKRIKKL